MSWYGSSAGSPYLHGDGLPVHLSGDNLASKGRNVKSIENLSPGIDSVTLIAAVIAKEDPRGFESRKNPGEMRHKLSFTLRDSAEGIINCTLWGTANVEQVSRSFHIGDVVEIQNPQVQLKSGDEDQYSPWTPSCFHLSLNEQHSSVTPHQGSHSLQAILRLPVKSKNDYYTLSDIEQNGSALEGQVITLLAAVKMLCKVRHFTTRQGRNAACREVKLFEPTCESFSLKLWGEERIHQSNQWIAGQTVLLATDVKVSYDSYSKNMAANTCCKTVIVADPNTREARELAIFSSSQKIPKQLTEGDDDGFDVSTITHVCTVKELVNRLKYTQNPDVSVIIYGVITSFNIDDLSSSPISFKCNRCMQRCDAESRRCTNLSCCDGSIAAYGDGDGQATAQPVFDISIVVSDHTGSLARCRIGSNTVQNLIQMTASEFLTISIERRTKLKWMVLFERFKLFVRAYSYGEEGSSRIAIRVVDASIADPTEILQFTKH